MILGGLYETVAAKQGPFSYKYLYSSNLLLQYSTICKEVVKNWKIHLDWTTNSEIKTYGVVTTHLSHFHLFEVIATVLNYTPFI